MKLIFLLLIWSLFMMSCSSDDNSVDILTCTDEILNSGDRIDEKVLSIQEYPIQIRSYINAELAGYSISEILTYSSRTEESYYIATLDNGASLLFDASAILVCADTNFRNDKNSDDDHLSYSELPQNIKDYLEEHYPGIAIDEAEYEDGEYEIELDNGIELCFDHAGNFIGEC